MSRPRRIQSLQHAEPTPPVRHVPARLTPAQRAGIRYEEKFQEYAASLWSPMFVPGQWFAFEDANGRGFCQTDGILRLKECVIVFEVKLSHRSEAYRQLAHLYRPVVEHVYERPARLCEVVKSVDLRSVRWPEEPHLMLDMDEFLGWVEGGASVPGVLLWK